MPSLAWLTALLMFGASEICARMFWPEKEDTGCLVASQIGLRFRPNCATTEKAFEGPWITARYNECGYRTSAPCGPKPAGTLRVVLLGSSTTEGLYIPYEQTFATRTGEALASYLHRPVQIENLGVRMMGPLACYRRLPEVLGLDPDVVVYSLALDDLKVRIGPQELARRNSAEMSAPDPPSRQQQNALQRVRQLLIHDSRSSQVAQHYIFEDTDRFINAYVTYGDKGSFFQNPSSAYWNARFDELQVLLTDMTARLRQRGVPLVIMAIPSRIEAALLSTRNHPANFDPYAFGSRIEQLTNQAGAAAYIDLLHPLSKMRKPEDLYFVVNSHLTGEGHAEIARRLVPKLEELLNNRKNDKQPQTSSSPKMMLVPPRSPDRSPF